MNVILGNINHDLIGITETLEETEGQQKHSDDSEVKMMEELSRKSKNLLSSQEGLLNQMKTSYDDVLKAQEGITKSLHAIGRDCRDFLYYVAN